MAMGPIKLVAVAFDGTRVKANASRLRTWTAQRVEEALKDMETQIERMLTKADAADAADAVLWDQGPSRELPPELADKQKRQEELYKTGSSPGQTGKQRDDKPENAASFSFGALLRRGLNQQAASAGASAGAGPFFNHAPQRTRGKCEESSCNRTAP